MLCLVWVGGRLPGLGRLLLFYLGYFLLNWIKELA